MQATVVLSIRFETSRLEGIEVVHDNADFSVTMSIPFSSIRIVPEISSEDQDSSTPHMIPMSCWAIKEQGAPLDLELEKQDKYNEWCKTAKSRQEQMVRVHVVVDSISSDNVEELEKHLAGLVEDRMCALRSRALNAVEEDRKELLSLFRK